MALSARAVSRPPAPPWSNLIGYLQWGEQAADRAGCLDTPPRRAPGNGVLPEPFASLDAPYWRTRFDPNERALRAAPRAKPRPGCGMPRRGFATHAAPGRGSAAPGCGERIAHAPLLVHEFSVPARTAVIQEDKGRETNGIFDPSANSVAETTAKCARFAVRMPS